MSERFRDTLTSAYNDGVPSAIVHGSAERMLQLNRAWVHTSAALLRQFMDRGSIKSARHHGLGMLQAELTDELRVHIWDPALVTMTEPFRNVHDHRFDLYSFIVVGSIEDHPYDVITRGEMRGEMLRGMTGGTYNPCVMWEVLHAKIQTPGSESGAKNLGPHYARQMKNVSKSYHQGETYFIPRRRFHTTKPPSTGRAITLVYRTNFDAENARVLGAAGSETLESGIVHHDALLTHKPCAEALKWAEGELQKFFEEFLVKEDPQ